MAHGAFNAISSAMTYKSCWNGQQKEVRIEASFLMSLHSIDNYFFASGAVTAPAGTLSAGTIFHTAPRSS